MLLGCCHCVVKIISPEYLALCMRMRRVRAFASATVTVREIEMGMGSTVTPRLDANEGEIAQFQREENFISHDSWVIRCFLRK